MAMPSSKLLRRMFVPGRLWSVARSLEIFTEASLETLD